MKNVRLVFRPQEHLEITILSYSSFSSLFHTLFYLTCLYSHSHLFSHIGLFFFLKHGDKNNHILEYNNKCHVTIGIRELLRSLRPLSWSLRIESRRTLPISVYSSGLCWFCERHYYYVVIDRKTPHSVSVSVPGGPATHFCWKEKWKILRMLESQSHRD